MNFVSGLVSMEGRVYRWDTISPKFELNPTEFLKWYGLKSVPYYNGALSFQKESLVINLSSGSRALL